MTDVPLREYLESKLDAIAAQIRTTADELERRLETMNEFRAQIQSERAEYVRRDTLDLIVRQLHERMATVDRRLSFVIGGSLVVAACTSILLWVLGKLIR